MKILVIGSEGTIGTELVKSLNKQRGLWVKRCDILRIKEDNYIMADMTHFDTLMQAFEPIPDVVFHLAAEVSRETAEYWPGIAVEKNVTGTLNVIKLCLTHGSNLIYAGTSEEYGSLFQGKKPVTEDMRPLKQQGIYGLTKWLAEELIEYYHRRYGLKAAVARIFMCYGPGERPSPFRSAISRFIDSCRRNEPIIVHRGSKRSWCYIDDVVSAFISILKYDSDSFQIFNIGRDELLSMAEVAQEIVSLTGSSSKIIYKKAPPGITLVKHASFSNARRILGWQARVPFKEGIKRTVKWHLDNIQ